MELTPEEAERYYLEEKYIVTYGCIYQLFYSTAQKRRGRFFAMDAETVNRLVGFNLVNSKGGISMKYYSTQRPVSPGTFPRQGAGQIVNFDNKQFCEEIGRDAWGYIEYEEPLSAAQLEAYELVRHHIGK